MAIELRTCQYRECYSVIYGSKNRKYCSDRCRKAAQRLRDRSVGVKSEEKSTDN